jgi:archaellum component FlaC
MASSGLENRYLARFTKLRPQTGENLKNIDSAGNLTEHLTQARASLKTQNDNIQKLMSTAQELIAGIDTTQKMFGHTYVRNMPLPNQDILQNRSKQWGYIQLTMRFMQAGIIHFMEEMSDATERIEQLERVISRLAPYDEEINILGELQSVDLDDLEKNGIDTLQSQIQTPGRAGTPITPPVSPSVSDQSVKAKESKDTKKAPAVKRTK